MYMYKLHCIIIQCVIIFNVKKFNNVCEYTDVRGPNYKHLYEFKNGVASGPCPATAA